MPFVKSRVNGLMVAIPNDARNVIHRFAVHGGGNELVFEPIKRKDFDASRRTETEPLGLGGPEKAPDSPAVDAPDRENAVTLTIGVAEDDDDHDDDEQVEKAPVAPVAAKPAAKPRARRPASTPRKATPSTDDITI